jgi:hypothetical protein
MVPLPWGLGVDRPVGDGRAPFLLLFFPFHHLLVGYNMPCLLTILLLFSLPVGCVPCCCCLTIVERLFFVGRWAGGDSPVLGLLDTTKSPVKSPLHNPRLWPLFVFQPSTTKPGIEHPRAIETV